MPGKSTIPPAVAAVLKEGDVDRVVNALEGRSDDVLDVVHQDKHLLRALEKWVFKHASFGQLERLSEFTNILDHERHVVEQMARVATPEQAGEWVECQVSNALPLRSETIEDLIQFLSISVRRSRAHAREISTALIRSLVYPGAAEEQKCMRLLRQILRRGL